MTVPCKDCITFAICNSRSHSIGCDLLDKYISYTKHTNKIRNIRKRKIEKMFNKEILHVDYYSTCDNEYKVTVWWMNDE